MSESEKRMERLAVRYWAFAAIPEEEKSGYVKGFLAGLREALSAAGMIDILSIVSKDHESGSSEVPEE